ncbi:hypothetical protein RclHR1_31870002 [Rhizophagus clarus]|uniref:Uncharacterized protein n=1 Tax=Rhizophagus clarus TaxID=94130 RepID=A0A2Z6S2P5_9GLOM|nr:hypothetical protein RclHR1_31870002 [Rhizophagus clarus]
MNTNNPSPNNFNNAYGSITIIQTYNSYNDDVVNNSSDNQQYQQYQQPAGISNNYVTVTFNHNHHQNYQQ